MRSVAAALLCLFAAATLAASAKPTKKDAELLKKKVAAIKQVAEKPVSKPVRTMVTEEEVNSYFAYEAGPSLPTGVVEPTVSILGAGRLSGRAVVDLDAVRKSRSSSSMFDPMSYLTGKLPITAEGTLTSNQGVGHFQLESASVGSVPVPKSVLQEIIGYYSRTPENPAGLSLDDPFQLPARIQEIEVLRGQAIIVQ
jgi:hypothetical protein